MKILFVTPRFPYPPLKGDQTVAYHRLRLLSREHEITLLTLYQTDKELAYSSKLESFCKKIVPVRLSRYGSALNMLKGIKSSEPFQVWYFKSKRFEKELKDLVNKGGFDIIHTYMLRLAGYTEDFNMPKILDLIDSMQLNFERRASLEKYPLKAIFNMELKRLKTYENKMVNKYDVSVVVSDKDKKYIDSTKVVSIPLGVDTDVFRPYGDLKKSKIIIFSGNMGYFPNENAILWFNEKCFSMIKEQVPDSRLLIVGNNPGPRLKAIHDGKSVIVTGYVDSMARALNEAEIAIAPMQAGSGMQFKILETMACALPVVTTSLGLGAISVVDGESILLADNPEQFTQACVSLLRDHGLARKIGRNGRESVVEKYSWEHNIARINEIYSAITQGMLPS